MSTITEYKKDIALRQSSLRQAKKEAETELQRVKKVESDIKYPRKRSVPVTRSGRFSMLPDASYSRKLRESHRQTRIEVPVIKKNIQDYLVSIKQEEVELEKQNKVLDAYEVLSNEINRTLSKYGYGYQLGSSTNRIKRAFINAGLNSQEGLDEYNKIMNSGDSKYERILKSVGYTKKQIYELSKLGIRLRINSQTGEVKDVYDIKLGGKIYPIGDIDKFRNKIVVDALIKNKILEPVQETVSVQQSSSQNINPVSRQSIVNNNRLKSFFSSFEKKKEEKQSLKALRMYKGIPYVKSRTRAVEVGTGRIAVENGLNTRNAKLEDHYFITTKDGREIDVGILDKSKIKNIPQQSILTGNNKIVSRKFPQNSLISRLFRRR